MMASQNLSIGIASKNRPEVLEVTLRKIHAFGLADYPLVLFDDGSTPPLNPPAIALFKNARIIRVEQSVGQALGRNRICEQVDTLFLLQLDDDSYPVEGKIEALLKLVSKSSTWLAIAIPFEEPNRGSSTVGIPSDCLIPIRSFVGCSALLQVKNFRMLGGYASWIGKYCEEDELTLRGWKEGFGTYCIDLLRIRHEVSEVERSRSGIAYRCFRNWFLTWMLHAPSLIVPIKVFRLQGAALVHSCRHRDLSALRGIFAAMQLLPSLWRYREALSLAEYQRFKRRPHALDFIRQQVN